MFGATSTRPSACTVNGASADSTVKPASDGATGAPSRVSLASRLTTPVAPVRPLIGPAASLIASTAAGLTVTATAASAQFAGAATWQIRYCSV